MIKLIYKKLSLYLIFDIKKRRKKRSNPIIICIISVIFEINKKKIKQNISFLLE
jgi:hypothetical protein